MKQPTVDDLVQSIIQATSKLQELPRQLEIDAMELEDSEYDTLRSLDEDLRSLIEYLGL